MKSKYFKNLAKGLVVVSAALALVNCGEVADQVNSAQQQYQQSLNPADPNNPNPTTNPAQQPIVDPASGQVLYPVVDPVTGETTYTPENPNQPATGDVTNPATESTVDPVTGEIINPPQGGNEEPGQQGTDPIVNPGDPCENSTLPNACGEEPGPGPMDTTITNPPVLSSSSEAIVDPAPLSSSSDAVKPASSSSEQKVESSSSEAKVEGGIFLAEDTDENKNYMEVEYIKNTADNGGGVLCYPKRLSDTKKHAVVLWGPGGGSNPNDYEGIIRRLASHGFVVVATSESPSSTNRGKPALDWLAKKNNTPGDPLYQKLDMTKVGASGHSMGGLQSEQMLINDDRVITALLNNSGDLGHTAMSYVSTSKTIAIVYGEGGMERPNAEADYNNQGVKAPACLIRMTGGKPSNECQKNEFGQTECGWGHGSGPWGGMAATVAWMRWHLGGEDFRKADFVGTSGRYINGEIVGQPGHWKGQCKNF